MHFLADTELAAGSPHLPFSAPPVHHPGSDVHCGCPRVPWPVLWELALPLEAPVTWGQPWAVASLLTPELLLYKGELAPVVNEGCRKGKGVSGCPSPNPQAECSRHSVLFPNEDRVSLSPHQPPQCRS